MIDSKTVCYTWYIMCKFADPNVWSTKQTQHVHVVVNPGSIELNVSFKILIGIFFVHSLFT